MTFCTGMKLHFKEPIEFGELSKIVMPSSAEEAEGTFTRYGQCGESSVKVEPSFLQTAGGSEGALLRREEVDDAIRLGLFGSPFFILDDEHFFGVDKLELIST